MRTGDTRNRNGIGGVCRLALLVCLTALLPMLGLAAESKEKQAPAVRIVAEPQHAMLAPGGAIDLQLRVLDKAGQPVAGELTARPADPGQKATAVSVTFDKSGCGSYRFAAPPGMEPGIHAIQFRHAPSGAVQNFYVDVADQATCTAFEKAAQQVKFSAMPAHLLFIGDSLTDLYRGQNYVDKVGFWLGKLHGNKATVKNAGVGGDTIVRVWQRLNKEPNTYRLAAYDDLYSPKPTHVFFFLGHNDSKLTSTSGYKDAVVAPAQFGELYGSALRKVQSETNARLVVLSATSSVYEITAATAARARASGKAHNFFGKPEALEQFNAIAKKAAAECQAEYLDVYEPTRRHPDKPSLFTKDGVHVSNLGNRLLALEILKYLGGKK